MSKEHTAVNKARSRLLLSLVIAVDALALVSIALLATGRLLERPLTLLVLLAMAAAVGARSIRIPRLGVRVVAADVFVLFALVALTPAAAPLIALASMLGAAATTGDRFLSIKTAFNVGAVPLSMAAGAWAFVALGGVAGSTLPAVLPLLAAAVVYALINVPLTATAAHLGTGQSWSEICRQSVGLALVSNITSALLGSSLLLVWSVVGPVGLALGLVPLAPLEQYIRLRARRVEDGDVESAILRELGRLSPEECDAADVAYPETVVREDAPTLPDQRPL